MVSESSVLPFCDVCTHIYSISSSSICPGRLELGVYPGLKAQGKTTDPCRVDSKTATRGICYTWPDESSVCCSFI